MSEITHNIQSIKAQIEQFNAHTPQQTQLLAVSKTKPLSAIKEAYQCGQRLFGENYVQEAVDKIQQLKQDSQPDNRYEQIVWHFIGPIQSNKTKLIAEHFDWVQSIDRIKIAQRLNDQRPTGLAKLNVCLQINISEEESKSGAKQTQMFELAELVNQLPNLQLRGIMCIPQKTSDPELQNKQLQQMQQLYLSLQAQFTEVDTLSMGMTNDMQVAIENGSTMVRIGTAIFGARADK